MSILAATSSLATTKRSRRGRIKLKSFQRGLMVAFFFYSDEETPGKEAAWNFLETWPECQRRSSTERYRFACAFPTSLPTWPLIDKNSNGIVLRYSSNFPPIFSWNQRHVEHITAAFWRVFFSRNQNISKIQMFVARFRLLISAWFLKPKVYFWGWTLLVMLLCFSPFFSVFLHQSFVK